LLLALVIVLSACSGPRVKTPVNAGARVEVTGLNSDVEGHRYTPGGIWSFYLSKHADEAAALAEEAVTSLKEAETFRSDEAAYAGYQLTAAVMASGLSPAAHAGAPANAGSHRSPRQQEAFSRGLQQLKDAAKLYNASLQAHP
jgi:hypothetical protein